MPFNVWSVAHEKWENLVSFKTRVQAIHFLRDVVEPERRRGGPFEVRRTGNVMEEHGTKLMQLKPSMIWRCAMDDLERRNHNKVVQYGEEYVEFKHYAFHRKHVLKAESANDIIRAAIEEPGLGRASGKRDTRLLYSDVELLKAALQ